MIPRSNLLNPLMSYQGQNQPLASRNPKPCRLGRMSGPDIDARATLVSSLRAFDDAAVMKLLQERPDLLHPIPPDFERLAARAVSPSSVARALDRINRSALQVIEALAVLPKPVSTMQLINAMGVTGKAVPVSIKQAMKHLRDLVLVWGDDKALLTPDSLIDVIGPYPCGLGVSAKENIDSLIASKHPDELEEQISAAPEDVRFVIEKLLWGPPVGKVSDANKKVTVESAKSPIEWLLARGLVIPTGPETIMLPKEVALALRENKLVKEVDPGAPEVIPDKTVKLKPDSVGGEIAFAFVKQTEQLLDAWSISPPPVLRSGGLSARDLTKAAELLDTDESATALIIEIAHAAGLLATDFHQQPSWAPTTGYDIWRIKDVATKWESLVLAWWNSARAIFLIGEKDEKGDRINALQGGLDRIGIPLIDLRTLALEAMQFGSTNAEQMVAWVSWHRPRRDKKMVHRVVIATLAQAELLGVSGMGRLTTAGKELLHHQEIANCVSEFLPTPIDYIMLQADLTAVAPGPLIADLERELSAIAEIESRGAATVYRFNEVSIRRGLDLGKSADGIKNLLSKTSKTPVPQPLTYLIEDTARKHGAIRLGAAPAYLRSDDSTLLDALMRDARITALMPQRIAPTVVIFQADPEDAAAVLSQSGYTPTLESADGSMLVRARLQRRATLEANTNRLEHPTDEVLIEAVKALRQG
ncbi:MAG: hypothetical protein FJW76_06435, partial [Actinobacteria bacterium]|nr:hypothetical protein [Actinomycetota bacterium]